MKGCAYESFRTKNKADISVILRHFESVMKLEYVTESM